MKLRSWGRLSEEEHPYIPLSRASSLHIEHPDKKILAHGMGRSYGDVCLNPVGNLLFTRDLDRFLSFNPVSGELVCEAGVLLGDIQRIFAPKGWMLPVTPGTQYVTMAGALANDVHGKNHHSQGCFSSHVNWLKLERTDGELITCSPSEKSGWFEATAGGLGLTGVIKQLSINLKPIESSWLDTETLFFSNLSEFFQLSEESEANWEYTVSWIDCSSNKHKRGIFIRANHSEIPGETLPAGRKLGIPFVPPFSLVNGLSVSAFNQAYFYAHKTKRGMNKSHYQSYFYPLDGILNWNRMYGPRGFYQYQLVIPRQAGQPAIDAVLDEISTSGQGSFLSVLKTFGNKPSPGLLSFPLEGVTLALDFPNRGKKTSQLFDRLDAIVKEAKGRLYPAKDARMPEDLFTNGYPNLSQFTAYRDPGISSGLSRRLMGW
ncbi:FAD binding domain protein [marine gamma proteobacterium HTCC2148]|nr:FAD binding domain protein [marine gamma proteobacterium HTCC2148]